MPNRPCRQCGKRGLVRHERVVKGGQSMRAFYCGACNQSWQEADGEPEAVRGSADTADRSRAHPPGVPPHRKTRKPEHAPRA